MAPLTGTLRDVEVAALVTGGWRVTAVYAVSCAGCKAARADGEPHYHDDHLERVGDYATLAEAAAAIGGVEHQAEVES